MGRRRHRIGCDARGFWLCVEPQPVPIGGLEQRIKGLWQLGQEEEANPITVEESSVEIDHDGVLQEQSAVGPHVARREEQVLGPGDFGEQLQLAANVQRDEPCPFQPPFQRLAVASFLVQPGLELRRVPRDTNGEGFTQLVRIAVKKRLAC
ncbi:hypothetical protein J3459_008264 [Metarhizium acridum]|nr:hypothetical protein J3459_008264 [Metarhizium acridum]